MRTKSADPRIFLVLVFVGVIVFAVWKRKKLTTAISSGVDQLELTLMAFGIKQGVYGTLVPEMDGALNAIQVVWAAHGLGAPVITSIQDGVHPMGNEHAEGRAVDIRLNNIPLALHETLCSEVRAAAGDKYYDVVHEFHGQASDHMHVEYDPH